jgi:hypothetical protein
MTCRAFFTRALFSAAVLTLAWVAVRSVFGV